MVAPEPIDLHHLDERVIGVYLLETDDGPALFDCGPATCVDALKAGLAARGLALRDVRHLLLSHIHLDHAGAAGALVREHPALRVHVSELGAPHLVDPTRLERSARRLYGDAFDALWGQRGGLYEVRLGWERAAGMNPFRSLLERGLEVGVGSDSPITPLDPMAALAALEGHHDPAQRLSRAEAIRLHTIGSARLAHQEGKKGSLEPGAHADLAAYELDPFEAEDLEDLRPVLTVSMGREVSAR